MYKKLNRWTDKSCVGAQPRTPHKTGVFNTVSPPIFTHIKSCFPGNSQQQAENGHELPNVTYLNDYLIVSAQSAPSALGEI